MCYNYIVSCRKNRCHVDGTSANAKKTIMDDTCLFVKVEKHTVIYDPHNLLYKDLQAKEKAWEEVASALGAESK